MLVIRAGIHKMLVTIKNRENPDQKQNTEAVCVVCLGLFGRQLAFKILENIPYTLNMTGSSCVFYKCILPGV